METRALKLFDVGARSARLTATLVPSAALGGAPFAYRPLRVVFRADAALQRATAPWGFSLFGQPPLTCSAALPPLPRPTRAAECESRPGPPPRCLARPSPIVAGCAAALTRGANRGHRVRQCVAVRHAGGVAPNQGPNHGYHQ